MPTRTQPTAKTPSTRPTSYTRPRRDRSCIRSPSVPSSAARPAYRCVIPACSPTTGTRPSTWSTHLTRPISVPSFSTCQQQVPAQYRVRLCAGSNQSNTLAPICSRRALRQLRSVCTRPEHQHPAEQDRREGFATGGGDCETDRESLLLQRLQHLLSAGIRRSV